MKKVFKMTNNFLRILLVISTLIYPGFMAMMSAAGWMYNVREGNYPDVFRAFAFWMYAGGGLLCAGTVLCLLGIRKRLWRCNPAAVCAGIAGCAACLSSLYRFAAYADQNFSGIGETMQPVSQMYRDRLLPVLLPAVLLLVLSVWQLLDEDARDYRNRKRREREAALNAEAPRILGD